MVFGLLGIDLQRRSRQIQCTHPEQNRLTGCQDTTQRAFAHERRGVEPDQIARPNERGWRGEEGGGKRDDALCMCALQVPTREKGGCEEMREG